MKKVKIITKSIIILCAMIAVVSSPSCQGEAKESIQEGDFKIDLLFEKDGCKIYRFNDAGRYIYWTNCQGNMQSNYNQQSGKVHYIVRMESFTSVQ
jgi:hypothetical protein